GRPVPVQLDAVALGVLEVEGEADEVVGAAHVPALGSGRRGVERSGEVRAVVEQHGRVVEPGGGGWGRRQLGPAHELEHGHAAAAEHAPAALVDDPLEAHAALVEGAYPLHVGHAQAHRAQPRRRAQLAGAAGARSLALRALGHGRIMLRPGHHGVVDARTEARGGHRLPLMIDLSGPAVTPEERDLLAEGRVAGVCLFGRNVRDRYQVADYVAELRALAGDDLVVAIDQEGGGVVRLFDVPVPPAAMALGAADDPELTRAVARAAARGLRAVGVNLDFAPVADVNSSPANPVIADRSFGADPELVSRHVAAFVTGLQEEDVGATLKHFPGHGDTDVDSHLALPTVARPLAALRRVELPPFVAGIAAGAAAVMSAHIVVSGLDPSLPCTLSRAALRGLLREELGFDGVIVTDALDMRAISERWPAPV